MPFTNLQDTDGLVQALLAGIAIRQRQQGLDQNAAQDAVHNAQSERRLGMAESQFADNQAQEAAGRGFLGTQLGIDPNQLNNVPTDLLRGEWERRASADEFDRREQKKLDTARMGRTQGWDDRTLRLQATRDALVKDGVMRYTDPKLYDEMVEHGIEVPPEHIPDARRAPDLEALSQEIFQSQQGQTPVSMETAKAWAGLMQKGYMRDLPAPGTDAASKPLVRDPTSEEIDITAKGFGGDRQLAETALIRSQMPPSMIQNLVGTSPAALKAIDSSFKLATQRERLAGAAYNALRSDPLASPEDVAQAEQNYTAAKEQANAAARAFAESAAPPAVPKPRNDLPKPPQGSPSKTPDAEMFPGNAVINPAVQMQRKARIREIAAKHPRVRGETDQAYADRLSRLLNGVQ